MFASKRSLNNLKCSAGRGEFLFRISRGVLMATRLYSARRSVEVGWLISQERKKKKKKRRSTHAVEMNDLLNEVAVEKGQITQVAKYQ